ncbi:histidine kinase/DNA gyrase B/HSP90-like ATPase [Paraburkholderia sp. RAU2J]|nr:histidine kinase/DNA gyrase B/HSP90-like ATPase [Paraburkholderia sp. RAU2J]
MKIPPGTFVCAEASQLQQVIVNLLGNALDAVRNEENRTITLEAVDSEANGRVLFSIADSGTGIAHEVLHHLFDPFITTKPRGHGQGLGLAITSRIVEAFGAKISATNRDEGGARFNIDFASAKGVVDGR